MLNFVLKIAYQRVLSMMSYKNHNLFMMDKQEVIKSECAWFIHQSDIAIPTVLASFNQWRRHVFIINIWVSISDSRINANTPIPDYCIVSQVDVSQVMSADYKILQNEWCILIKLILQKDLCSDIKIILQMNSNKQRVGKENARYQCCDCSSVTQCSRDRERDWEYRL